MHTHYKGKDSYLYHCCLCFHRPMGCCASFVLLHDRSGFCVVRHVKAPPTFPIVGWWSMYFKTTISTKKHRLKCKWDTRFIVTTRLRLVWHGVVSARLVQLPPYYDNDETGSKNGDEGPTNTGIGTCVSLLRRWRTNNNMWWWHQLYSTTRTTAS